MLDDAAPRVVQNLKSFLEVIAKGKAGLRLESGDFRCEMSQTRAANAFSRVAETTTQEEEVKVAGVLKGVLLESWAFNFSADDGASIAGKIDQIPIDEQVEGALVRIAPDDIRKKGKKVARQKLTVTAIAFRPRKTLAFRLVHPSGVEPETFGFVESPFRLCKSKCFLGNSMVSTSKPPTV